MERTVRAHTRKNCKKKTGKTTNIVKTVHQTSCQLIAHINNGLFFPLHFQELRAIAHLCMAES